MQTLIFPKHKYSATKAYVGYFIPKSESNLFPFESATLLAEKTIKEDYLLKPAVKVNCSFQQLD